MKKVAVILAFLSLIASCSSDDKSANADSQIFINGNKFNPTLSTTYSATFENMRRTQFVLDSTSTCVECAPPPYKRINLNIYSDLAEDVEGVYDFDAQRNENRYMVAGYYLSGYPINIYSGTITVKKLNNKRYRLEFNDVKGKFFLSNTSETEFQGYFEGDFKEIEQPYYD